MRPAEYDRDVQAGVPGSAVSAPDERDQLPRAVRALAAELLATAPDLARGMADHLVAAIPELAAGDELLREETRASSEANIAQVLQLLKLGVGADALVVPIEAAEWARVLVRRGITLAALLRAYRLGHAWLWDRWSQALQERLDDSAALVTAQDQSSAFMFAYIDRICDVLVGEYGSERERVMRSAEQLRAETVRAILGGEAIDEEVAASRLGYELRRHHVALRVAVTGSEVRGLERAAAEAAALLGAGQPLIVPSGVASLDVWCGSFASPDAGLLAQLDAFTPPAGVRVAVGSPGEGIGGFRRSHTEAVQTARIAALAGGAVTTYARVELVTLLASDLPRARAFVASRLGPLAAPTEPVARLRDTVLAFLKAGGSSTQVAAELFVHQNTVAYRVKRAEELLGRRVTEDPIELSCALTLAAVLGPAVLSGDGFVTTPQQADEVRRDSP
jgi:DNA-binding PucR family transcriptional regulator